MQPRPRAITWPLSAMEEGRRIGYRSLDPQPRPIGQVFGSERADALQHPEYRTAHLQSCRFFPTSFNRSNMPKRVQTCLRDEGVDGVLAILSPHSEAEAIAVAEALVQATRNSSKPILSAWMGEGEVNAARKILEAGRIPNYRFPESAVDAFIRIHRYVRDLELLYETPAAIPKDFEPEQAKARTLIQTALADQRNVLLDHEAKALSAAYQIPVNPGAFCQSADEAAEAGLQLGFPGGAQTVSPEIGHKTDVGGVQLHIQDENALRLAYRNILHNLEKQIQT